MLRGEEVVFWYNVCVGWLVFVDRLIGVQAGSLRSRESLHTPQSLC